MTFKQQLRKELTEERKAFDTVFRLNADKAIADTLFLSEEYRSCREILIYISGTIEVGTLQIIEKALNDGKAVCCPRCIKGSNDMDFYRISSLNDTEPGYMGIPEPKIFCPPAVADEGSLCIVPALGYDSRGYRIGFGKGFYDKYLSRFPGLAAGICYDSFILADVIPESHDKPVDMIITESKTVYINHLGEE